MLICNGVLTYTRYASWGRRTSVNFSDGMLEYNDTEVPNGYICEWGDPIALTTQNVFLNGQNKNTEAPVKYRYNGNLQQPQSVAVYYEDVRLVLNQDYTQEISPRSQVGVAKVYITGINRYQGLATKYYYIVPNTPATPTVLNGSSHTEHIIQWSNVEYAKGYLLEYSTDASFQSDVERRNIIATSEDGLSEYIVSDLDSESAYYVRIASLGDLKDEDCSSGWSGTASITWNSGYWMTIFSNQNSLVDGGHAFMNFENCTSQDVYIGPFKLAAGDNVYIAGRGVIFENFQDETEIKKSDRGAFINFESVYDKNHDGGIYNDFAWYTVSIQKDDFDSLYACMKSY